MLFVHKVRWPTLTSTATVSFTVWRDLGNLVSFKRMLKVHIATAKTSTPAFPSHSFQAIALFRSFVNMTIGVCFMIVFVICLCQSVVGLRFGAMFVSLPDGAMLKSRQSHRLSTELYFKTHNDDEKVNPAPLYNTNQECKREVPFKHSKFAEKAIHTPKPEYGHRYHLRLIKPDPINLISRKHEVDSLLRVLPDLSRSIAENVVERAHEVGRALIRVFNTKDQPEHVVEQLRHFHPPIKAEIYDTKTLSILTL